MEKTALILVDIQNDYFPNGRMELHEPDKAAANARKLLDFYRSKNMPTFHIQHIFNDPNAPFFAPGTEGIIINETVAPLEGETVIQKNYPNSFRETTLLNQLQEVGTEHVVVCGMMSHMCIDATARAAVDNGFQCTVIEDACTSPDLSFRGRNIPATDVHDAFMAALGSLYATIETADSFLENATVK
ncbi:cysteine hydrolase [Peribacillus cavernae]|uniref:Cysteine hydrolase n=1 Tax=Peribacillus cavernae TaxID=1674310 RepID=A0A3S0TXC6_9BACI|nr:cysteine hydrolase family protein [Peribacillus cavernae]MDQ0219911.1 nicotinamidase-related amidase [Peribacillus cavernae]RUQ26606.1 cysteine hydrolase [Peribacillus cavernae]